jgi:hypothetical protein
MQVILSTESPDLPGYKCLALGIFSDEKPPRGICGFLDWRLNGFISREMKQGRISGEFREKVIIPFPRRVNAEILFLFGLGPLAEFNYDRSYASAYSIVEVVDGMRLTDFAFDLPGENRGSLALAGITEAMVTGFFDYLSHDVEKLANVTARIITSPDNLKEISAGIRRFKSNVKDMGSVDASALEDSFA